MLAYVNVGVLCISLMTSLQIKTDFEIKSKNKLKTNFKIHDGLGKRYVSQEYQFIRKIQEKKTRIVYITMNQA